MDDVFDLSEDDFPASSSKYSVKNNSNAPVLSSLLAEGNPDASGTPSMKHTNTGEVQRLLRENKKLRQENLTLKIEVERHRLQGKGSSTSRLQPSDPMKESETDPHSSSQRSHYSASRSSNTRNLQSPGDEEKGNLKGQEVGSSASRDGGDASSKKKTTTRRENEDEEGATKMTLKLKEEVQQLTSRNRQLQEALSTSTLVYTEREHVFGRLYYDLQVELEALREEKNDLKVALQEAREKLWKAETAPSVEAPTPASTTDSVSALGPPTTCITSTEEVLPSLVPSGEKSSLRHTTSPLVFPRTESGNDPTGSTEFVWQRLQQEISLAFHRTASATGMKWDPSSFLVLPSPLKEYSSEGNGVPTHFPLQTKNRSSHQVKKQWGGAPSKTSLREKLDVFFHETEGTSSQVRDRAHEGHQEEEETHRAADAATNTQLPSQAVKTHPVGKAPAAYQEDHLDSSLGMIQSMPEAFREELERQRQAVLASTEGLRLPKGAGVLRAPPRGVSRGGAVRVPSPSSSTGMSTSSHGPPVAPRKRGRPPTKPKVENTERDEAQEDDVEGTEKRRRAGEKEEEAERNRQAHNKEWASSSSNGSAASMQLLGALPPGRMGASSSLLEGSMAALPHDAQQTTKQTRITKGKRRGGASSTASSTSSSVASPFLSPSSKMENPFLNAKMVARFTTGVKHTPDHPSASVHAEGDGSSPAVTRHHGEDKGGREGRRCTPSMISGQEGTGGAQGVLSRRLSLEAYIYRVCRRVPLPSSSSLLRDQQDLLRSYPSSNWSAMAEDIVKFLLKAACHPSVLSTTRSERSDGLRNGHEGVDSSDCPALPQESAPDQRSTPLLPSAVPSCSASPFASWTKLWSSLSSSSLEDTVWRVLQAVLPLNRQSLFAALQASFCAGLLALMQHRTEGSFLSMDSKDKEGRQTRMQMENEDAPQEEAATHGGVHRTGQTHSFLTAVWQMHTLATALNFLWLQDVIDRVEKLSESNSLERPTYHRPASSSSSLSSLERSVSSIREHIVQLLMDLTLLALRGWSHTASLVSSSSAADAHEPHKERRSTSPSVPRMTERSSTVEWPRAIESRSSILFLWMTCWRALLGRTLHRHLRFISFSSSSVHLVREVYEELFLYDVVVPSFGLSHLLLSWRKQEASLHSTLALQDKVEKREEEEKARSSPSGPSSGVESSLSIPSSSLSSPFRSHGLMIYAMKSIMASCITILVEDLDQHYGTPPLEEETAPSASSWSSASYAAALPPPHHTEALSFWQEFTRSIGWSVAVCDVGEMTRIAVQLALRVPPSKEERQETIPEEKRREQKDEDADVEGSQDDASGADGNNEAENASLSSSTSSITCPRTAPLALPPLSASEQARLLLKWENNNGAALLALRFIVFFKGFNYIASVVQPLVQAALSKGKVEEDGGISAGAGPCSTIASAAAKTTSGKGHEDGDPEGGEAEPHGPRHDTQRCIHRGDDLMAYILSTAVMDFRLVVESTSTNILSSSSLTSPIPAWNGWSLSPSLTTVRDETVKERKEGDLSTTTNEEFLLENRCVVESSIMPGALATDVLHSGVPFSNTSLEDGADNGPVVASSVCHPTLHPRLLSGNGEVSKENKGRGVSGEEKELHEGNAYVRILEFLREYVWTTTMRPPSRVPIPFTLVSTTQVLSVAGIMQLFSGGSCSSAVIQHYLLEWRSWLRTAVKKFAAQKGLGMHEDAKLAIPRVVEKDSAWRTRTGQWILEVLLP